MNNIRDLRYNVKCNFLNSGHGPANHPSMYRVECNCGIICDYGLPRAVHVCHCPYNWDLHKAGSETNHLLQVCANICSPQISGKKQAARQAERKENT
jgi:hypothetical protein